MPITKRALLLCALVVFVAPLTYAYYPQYERVQTAQVANSIAQRIVTADFNGDGRPDVVTYGGFIKLLLGLPGGTFALPVDVNPGPITSFGGMVALDGNEDGRADLVVGDTGSRLLFLAGNADGTFGAPVAMTLTFSPTFIGKLRTGDFNGDGHGDVVIGNADLAVVFAGDGTGQFAEVWRRENATSVLASAGDLDGDGRSDLIFSKRTANEYELFFGKADGTFDGPTIVANTLDPSSVLVADLDGDGDGEIIAASFTGANEIHVHVNTGSRTFAGAGVYPVGASPQQQDVFELAVADVTGDSSPDVIATLQHYKYIATFAGNGNGTLRSAAFEALQAIPDPIFPISFPSRSFVAGDFTGDGQTDLVVTGGTHLGLYKNQAGVVRVALKTLVPTVSEGTSVTLEVELQPVGSSSSLRPRPAPTGLLTIQENGTPLGSWQMSQWKTPTELPSLGVGDHALTAVFAGDENYRPSTSSAIAQKVTAEKTTTVLTADRSEIAYGSDLHLHAEVTSPLPGDLSGWVLTLIVDGQRQLPAYGPSNSWSFDTLAPGDHEFVVEFAGTATQPPSRSSVVDVTVVKGPTKVRLNTNAVVREGWQPAIDISVDGQDPMASHNGIGAGTVRLYVGTELIATGELGGGYWHTMTMPVLPQGVHFIRVAYSGTENWGPSQSEPFRYTVLPDTGLFIQASPELVSGAMAIRVRSVSSFGSSVTQLLYQRVNDGPWTLVNPSPPGSTDVTIFNPIPDAIYLYRMDVRDFLTNQLLGSSNIDTAIVFPFTDQPLFSGTTIKAVHVEQLLQVINSMRTIVNLNPVTLTGVAAGQPIRSTHLTQLRTALNQARAVLGMSWLTFSDGGTVGTRVQARHFQELRDAMQ